MYRWAFRATKTAIQAAYTYFEPFHSSLYQCIPLEQATFGPGSSLVIFILSNTKHLLIIAEPAVPLQYWHISVSCKTITYLLIQPLFPLPSVSSVCISVQLCLFLCSFKDEVEWIVSMKDINKIPWIGVRKELLWTQVGILEPLNRWCIVSVLLTIQFSSVTQSCPTLCDSMDCSKPGFPVRHQLPKLTQTHVHRVGDAIQPFHPLSSPSSPAFNLSQHQGLFQWVRSSHQVAKVLEGKYWSWSLDVTI